MAAQSLQMTEAHAATTVGTGGSGGGTSPCQAYVDKWSRQLKDYAKANSPSTCVPLWEDGIFSPVVWAPTASSGPNGWTPADEWNQSIHQGCVAEPGHCAILSHFTTYCGNPTGDKYGYVGQVSYELQCGQVQ